MKNYLNRFVKICPKTGHFRGFRPLRGLSRLLYPLIGLLALIWILIRVIPKPSRLNYPCIRSAMPFASGFLAYLFILIITAISSFRSKKVFYRNPAFYAGAFLIFVLSSSYNGDNGQLYSSYPVYPDAPQTAGTPVGDAKGIFPGRVVWVHNAEATNENCNPKQYGHSYYMSENSNQTVIDAMLSSALHALSGKKTDSESWQAVFSYHNSTRGKDSTGYKKGEKIFIKINATSAWQGNFNRSDLTPVKNDYYGISETSPQIILSVLRQLVNTVGAEQNDIYVGDPMKHIYKHMYDILHSEFPDVHFLDHDGYAGREIAAKSNYNSLFFSDSGSVLRSNGMDGDPVYFQSIYEILQEAEYIINIPMLKGHTRAGITMFAKNHFGSIEADGASLLHMGLVAPDAVHASREGFGIYRVQVDLMAHEVLRKKNIFYLCDALWASDYELNVPVKWKMQPFNYDWMSSLFLSFDPVASEAVGLDFLRAEFTSSRGLTTYAQMIGVDDYLLQAADSANWPRGIKYDPDHSGKYFSSLGTFEHWNDSRHKQYSRNLGKSEGIELYEADASAYVYEDNQSQARDHFILYCSYPNPFNPSTNIRYFLPKSCFVSLKIYDSAGREVSVLVSQILTAGSHTAHFNAGGLPSGIYFYQMLSEGFKMTKKFILLK